MSGKNLDLNYGESPVDYLDKKLAPARTTSAKKKKPKPQAKGCPGNDGKEHVYAHVLSRWNWAEHLEVQEYHHWGPCIGCGHQRFGRKHTKPDPNVQPDIVKDSVYTAKQWAFFKAVRQRRSNA